MFFNAIDDDMRKLYMTDKDKHDILLWIIYNTNYQEEYNGLGKYQCYISLRTLSENTKVDYAKTQRIFKKLEQDGYITYTFKSKSKHKPSIIHCHFIESKVALSNSKYLVASNDNENSLEPHRELSTDNSTNISNDNIKSDTEPSTMSTNEMLLNNSKKFDKKLDETQRELLNGLDTDRLMKAIADAESTGKYKTYNFAYLLGAYNKLKEAPEDKSSKVNTKYHGTFNEHFRKYDDLEAKLLKMQNKMSFASNL